MRRVVRTVASLDPDRADIALVAAWIDPESRPETLAPEDFARLLTQLQAVRGTRDVSDPGS
jgi:16S rRNA A1518/A1519 N6-dimethyltransferase RsmA/KsgA/DIM1 with predicted DNA glycosylase/AP lyase activity